MLKRITFKSCFTTHLIQDDPIHQILGNFSSLTLAVRVVSWCLRFLSNCNSTIFPIQGPLSPIKFQRALKILVKKTQARSFASEIHCLKSRTSILKKSNILALNPFLDKDQILRVGGRLRHSNLKSNHKFPMLLPRHSKLTELVINTNYLKHLHSGCSLTFTAIQREFWIVRGRDAVEFHIRKCVRCAKVAAKPEFQFMGDLPSSKLTPTHPFDQCGVNYAGPFHLKSGNGKKVKINKAYLALFVCFTTRAFHLELVSSLSTDAFLAAFKRFVSRRGLPSHIHSDCGTNFVGASRELKSLLSSQHNK